MAKDLIVRKGLHRLRSAYAGAGSRVDPRWIRARVLAEISVLEATPVRQGRPVDLATVPTVPAGVLAAGAAAAVVAVVAAGAFLSEAIGDLMLAFGVGELADLVALQLLAGGTF